jgi:cytoskeletal protein CcmA (bactofilin family)
VNDETDEAERASDGAAVVVGAGARFEGLLSFWGRARVDGAVQGSIVADGVLEVGPEATIAARIEVDVLVVEGLVEGEVAARERVEICAGGRITADVRTPRLVLAEGGSIEGRIVMTERSAGSAKSAATAATAA